MRSINLILCSLGYHLYAHIMTVNRIHKSTVSGEYKEFYCKCVRCGHCKY